MINKESNLIDDFISYMASKGALQIKETREELLTITGKYYIVKVENNEEHPDLLDNIQLFLSAKGIEGLSETTLYGYKLELNIFSSKIKSRVDKITADDIRVFLASFTHLKMSSLSRKLTVLKSFFGWLFSEGVIQQDPTLKIKPPKTEKLLPKALSIEELEMLRESCETRRQRAVLEVMYATGCRLSEVHDMNIQDINYQAMSCRVIGKGSKEREVYLSFKAIYHLKKYLQTRGDDCSALFTTERKPYRRLSKRAIQREVGKIADISKNR